MGHGIAPLESLDVKPLHWKNRRVFVTGVTGFKGAWLALWLRRLEAEVSGYSLAPPTSPSLFEHARVRNDVDWVDADVRDIARLTLEMERKQPDIIFHLAAQSLVRTSYETPVETFHTNLMGTVNVLQAARVTPSVRAVVVVTSDKCYDNREWLWPYRECDALGGYDPYSASKACAELATAAYRHSFFTGTRVAIATVRAGNVIGGADWATDRLVPDVIAAITAKRPAAIRNPSSVRPWQHVLEPLHGYLTLADRLLEDGNAFGEAWNFGPSAESVQTVAAVADELCRAWGEGASWSHDTSHHPREAGILTLDSTKAQRRLDWYPRLDYHDAVDWTVSWFKSLRAGRDAKEVTLQQIDRYQELP
jgi:CDP-glucose 4,6-dehydratase